MAIESAAIVDGATTYVSPTGGSATTLNVATSYPQVKARLDSESGILDRTTVEFSAKDPVVSPNAPGGYTQSRCRILIKEPMTLANGNRTTNTIEINYAVDPEMANAAAKSLRLLASQIMGSNDFNDFFNSHDLS